MILELRTGSSSQNSNLRIMSLFAENTLIYQLLTRVMLNWVTNVSEILSETLL